MYLFLRKLIRCCLLCDSKSFSSDVFPTHVKHLGQALLSMTASRSSSISTKTKRNFSKKPLNNFQNNQVHPKMFGELDPYNYTSGRWLNRDQLQRDARFVEFNFSALCKKVLQLCPGAHKITSCEKKEGGFNRVFIFTMNNGGRVVARVPFRIAGPERLTTHSEVATMAYIRQHTDILVPKILEWNDNKRNSIGTEYIIMEHAPGVQLHGEWPKMNPVQHMRCVRALAKTIKSIAALSFPAYGSIYFADAQLDPHTTIPLGDFCIGPNCMREYWDCNPGESRYYQQRRLNNGPWSNLSQYCKAILDQGISRIPGAEAAPKSEPSYRGSVKEHHRLLSHSTDVIGALQESSLLQYLSTPTLLHADLHKRNIFVSEDDPTTITSIIDWQFTSIEPAFAYANETPDLINANSVPASILAAAGQEVTPEDSDEDPEMTEKLKAIQKDEWGCYQTFEIAIKVDVPKLSAARHADQNLLRPLRYCGTSWRDGAAATRQELIDLSKRWNEIGLPGKCPYQPSPEELAAHTPEYDEFEMRQGFKSLIKEMIGTDSEGWVHPEDWEAAKETHKDAFEWWLQDAEESDEPGISAEYIKKLWPFDIEKKENK